MNYPQTMAENITARYDAMREIRDAKERLKALESQWADIAEEVKQQDILAWVDFCYGGEHVKAQTWEQVADEWESKNPGWKVCNNGLRKISLPNVSDQATEGVAQRSNEAKKLSTQD